jgi:hypothetical protein
MSKVSLLIVPNRTCAHFLRQTDYIECDLEFPEVLSSVTANASGKRSKIDSRARAYVILFSPHDHISACSPQLKMSKIFVSNYFFKLYGFSFASV